MSPIKCCRYCVAPKRYPGCHDKCPEYIKQKKLHDAFRKAERQRNREEYLLSYVKRKIRSYRKKS